MKISRLVDDNRVYVTDKERYLDRQLGLFHLLSFSHFFPIHNRRNTRLLCGRAI